MTNPWIERPEPAPAQPEPVRVEPVWASGADVSATAALPVVEGCDSGLYLVGAHGGAGVSTLAGLLGARDAGMAWPVSTTPSQVIVVARTHRHGLACAQRAAIQWASGSVEAQLLGLLLVADAPKPARDLRDMQRLVAGAFPRVWEVEWVEAWRTQVPGEAAATRKVARLSHQIATLTRKAQP